MLDCHDPSTKSSLSHLITLPYSYLDIIRVPLALPHVPFLFPPLSRLSHPIHSSRLLSSSHLISHLISSYLINPFPSVSLHCQVNYTLYISTITLLTSPVSVCLAFPGVYASPVSPVLSHVSLVVSSLPSPPPHFWLYETRIPSVKPNPYCLQRSAVCAPVSPSPYPANFFALTRSTH